MNRYFGAGVIARKELAEHLRDRRTLSLIALPVLLGPVMIWFMFQ